MKTKQQIINEYITEQLWKEYRTELLAYIKSRIACQSDADDILQETFIDIYMQNELFKNNANTKNNLYRIARKAILKHYCDYEEIEELLRKAANMEAALQDAQQQLVTGILLPVYQPRNNRKGVNP